MYNFFFYKSMKFERFALQNYDLKNECKIKHKMHYNDIDQLKINGY